MFDLASLNLYNSTNAETITTVITLILKLVSHATSMQIKTTNNSQG
jgi:hypothetical protein